MARDLARGSFGFFHPGFVVTEKSVTVSRKPLLLPFVALIPLGMYVFAYPFLDDVHHGRGTVKLAFFCGFLLVVLGALGVRGSPLWPPSRVRISAKGVRWGGLRVSLGDIAGIAHQSIAESGRHGMTYKWSLVLTRTGAPPLRMLLTTSRWPAVPAGVSQVVDAANVLVFGGGGAPDALPQWAPAGRRPAALTEPLVEPTFRQHLAEGREIERALYGTYTAVAIEVKSSPRVMKYRYRLFLLPRPGADPVFAVNLEQSPFGTSALGVHRGATHINFGDAAPDMPYETFLERARAALDEELLPAAR